MMDPCLGCEHNPHPGALHCTGGFDVMERENPSTNAGWASPVYAVGKCPFKILKGKKEEKVK